MSGQVSSRDSVSERAAGWSLFAPSLQEDPVSAFESLPLRFGREQES